MRAGLLAGDVVVSWDGEQLSTSYTLKAQCGSTLQVLVKAGALHITKGHDKNGQSFRPAKPHHFGWRAAGGLVMAFNSARAHLCDCSPQVWLSSTSATDDQHDA